MNNTNNSYTSVGPDSLEARFAMRVAARLTEQTLSLPADIGERLRFAREQALARAGVARAAAVAQPQVSILSGAGAASVLLGGAGGWWVKIASVLPLLALVAGLLLIGRLQTAEQISVAAEVDAALLADTLPPNAYSDAGFVEFLKTPPN
jgi:Protein of unknown function (DUF3619)